ncbi:MAG: hypothetical protein J6L86_04160, partial [Alphaproteobacteria bacterium]|nr:hypothetical protein [Alphaproteobacteria bacterium]
SASEGGKTIRHNDSKNFASFISKDRVLIPIPYLESVLNTISCSVDSETKKGFCKFKLFL